MSVFQFVEKLGFSFVITPTVQQQFTGFYRRGDAGQYQCIPVVCDKSRGLYWLYYAIAPDKRRNPSKKEIGPRG